MLKNHGSLYSCILLAPNADRTSHPSLTSQPSSSQICTPYFRAPEPLSHGSFTLLLLCLRKMPSPLFQGSQFHSYFHCQNSDCCRKYCCQSCCHCRNWCSDRDSSQIVGFGFFFLLSQIQLAFWKLHHKDD